MKNFPEIRIKNAWLIYHNISVPLHELRNKNKKMFTLTDVDKKVVAYKKEWGKYENKILQGLHKLTGLTFRQNIIDVYIAPGFAAFSDPLVIGMKYSPKEFVDILTHELIHRLLTDNTKINSINLIKKWKTLFGDNHSQVTLVHIPVHSIHKAVILDVLKDPKRIDSDIKMMQKYKAMDYLKSWEYVNSGDYKKLVKDLSAIYKE